VYIPPWLSLQRCAQAHEQRENTMINVKKLSHFLGRSLAATGTLSTLAASAGVISIMAATPASACDYEPFIGSICIMATSFCPQGYVPANGQALSINQYQALYSLITELYAPKTPSEFVVPDLRGRSPIGNGAGPGLNSISLGTKVGAQQALLQPTQVPVGQHIHSTTFTGTGSTTQSVEVPAQAGTLAVSAKLLAKQVQGGPDAVNGAFLGQGSTSGGTQAPIYVPAATTAGTAELGGLDVQLTGTPGSPKISFPVTTGITGGSVTVQPNSVIPATVPVSTQSPGLALTVCIAVNGIYPQRP
jgi:microcystin-dependent protein